MSCQNTYVDSPVGWGSTYCFTDVRIGVDVLIRVTLTEPLLQFFLGGMFFALKVKP